MGEVLAALMGFGFAILIALLVFVLAIYIAIGIFLNKFNKLVEGKGTALAWIPIVNTFLLGKLLISKTFGWVLLVIQILITILTSTTTTTINGETTTTSLISEPLGSIINTIWGIACLCLFIWAIVKYFQTKKELKGNNHGKNDNTAVKANPADSLWGWKDSDSSKM